MEILKHKDTIEELVTAGDEIMKTCTEEEKQTMKVNKTVQTLCLKKGICMSVYVCSSKIMSLKKNTDSLKKIGHQVSYMHYSCLPSIIVLKH